MAATSPAQTIVVNTAGWRNIKACVTYDYEGVENLGTTFKACGDYDMLMETLKVHGALELKDQYTNLGRNPGCKIVSIKYGDEDEEQSILNDANYAAYLYNPVLPSIRVSYVCI